MKENHLLHEAKLEIHFNLGIFGFEEKDYSNKCIGKNFSGNGHGQRNKEG